MTTAVWLQNPVDETDGKLNIRLYADMGIREWMGIYTFPWEGPPRGVQAPGFLSRVLPAFRDHDIKFFANTETLDAAAWLAANRAEWESVLGGVLIGDEPDMERNHKASHHPDAWVERAGAIRQMLPGLRLYANMGKGFAKIPWPGYSPANGGGPFIINDHEKYLRHLDLVSVDIYNTDPYEGNYAGLWILPLAVMNTKHWTKVCGKGHIPVYGFVECGNAFGHLGGFYEVMPPLLVGAAFWLQIIAGADGILYFPQHRLQSPPPHILPPSDKYPLVEPVVGRVMKATNELYHQLKPVIDSPAGTVEMAWTGAVRPLSMVRQHGGKTYLFIIGNGDVNNPHGVTTPIQFAAAEGATDLVTGRQHLAVNGIVTDQLGPYHLRIFQID